MSLFYKILLIILLVNATVAYSCMNEYNEDQTRLNGSFKHVTDEFEGTSGYYFENGFDIEYLNERKKEYENILSRNKNYKNYSDYAVVLLKLGKYKEGLEILEREIKSHPNEYNLVVNLGTAYELNNQPELALKYIKKAVKINPKSHNNSEWIHVKILEAMIEMKKDKDYLLTHSILNLGIPNDIKEYYEGLTKKEIEKLSKIREQIAWQLKERMKFVDPPNQIVADLLYDLGNVVAVTLTLERSIPIYNKSLEYKPADNEQVLFRRDELKKKMKWVRMMKYIKGGAVILAVIGGTTYLIVRRRKKYKASLSLK